MANTSPLVVTAPGNQFSREGFVTLGGVKGLNEANGIYPGEDGPEGASVWFDWTPTPTDESRDIHTLRNLANQVETILRSSPFAARVHTDWDVESSGVKLEIDPDRADLAGVTNLDVANSSTAAMSGAVLTAFREGDQQIPVVARLALLPAGACNQSSLVRSC